MLFVFKKMVSAFVLPPGLFVVLLVVSGCWALARKRQACGVSAIAVGALIWLISMAPVADFLKGGLEHDQFPPEPIDADVILMLSAGLYDRSPDLSGAGAPGPETMERLVTAARLHLKYHIPIVVSGGKLPADASQSIAAVAKRFLIDLGIPSHAVIAEERSRDTYENALYCKSICQTHGYSRPLMVTSGYHIKRARWSFAKVGLTVTPFPCALTTWPGKTYRMSSYLPSCNALKTTAQALHEWIGLFYYRLVY